MRRALALLACLATALACAGCGGKQGIEVSPRIHDFGRVRQGETPARTFTITNHTDRVVSVMPQPNCSCFAVPRGRNLEPLDPGTSMKIQVLFDSTAKPPGPVQGKWISFNFDHPEHRQVNVPLSGEIFRAFDVRPTLIPLGRIDGRPENHKPRTVTIQPEPGYEVRVTRVVVNPPIFDHAITAGERGATKLALSLQKDLRPRPLGAFRANVRLELEVKAPGGKTYPQRPAISIQGYWAIRPDGTAIK